MPENIDTDTPPENILEALILIANLIRDLTKAVRGVGGIIEDQSPIRAIDAIANTIDYHGGN